MPRAEKANHHNCGGEYDAKPAKSAMQFDLVRANQRGLKDEEQHPAGKDDGVDGEDEGRQRRSVQKIVRDGLAEAVDHDHGNQERHTEVEVLAEESRGGGVRAREGYGPGRHWVLLMVLGPVLRSECVGGRAPS